MRRLNLSVSGVSVCLAVVLAIWEVLFFFFGWEGIYGWFVPHQLGFEMAWITAVYLAFQLVSIPFAMRGVRGRFIGVVDGMASFISLLIVVVVVFGRPHLLGTPERWSAALLLVLVTATDLFGGYVFNIALSKRMFDVGGAGGVSLD